MLPLLVLMATVGQLPAELAVDPRLDDAAAGLAREILSKRALDETGRGFTAARMAMWERGVIDAHVTWIAACSDGASREDELWQTVDRQREGYDHAGFGIAGDGRTTSCAVVLLTRRDLFRLDPLPWEPGAGETFRFSLREGLGRPDVDWITPDGSVVDVDVASRATGGYEARLASPAQPGVHRLEVRAIEDGRELLAAIAAAEVGPRFDGPGMPRDYLLGMMQAERSRYDLPEVEVSPHLAEVAAEHSRLMRDGADFGHRSPLEPHERIARAQIPFSVALENVARAETLDWIHTLFMASPDHRANVLHPRVTHVGIGVARSEPLAWYATVDLVRLLPPLELPAELGRAREAIERARAGGPQLRRKRILDSLADGWCTRIGRWGRLTQDQVDELVGEVRFHISDTEHVVADLAVVEDVDEVSWLDELFDPRFDQYGLGIYQEPEGGMIHVLVILVDRKGQ